VSASLDQVAGLLAGASLFLALTGYVLYLQHSRVQARLGMFVGGGSLSAALGASETPSTRSLLRFAAWHRIRIGARPGQLIQAGLAMTPRRFVMLQLVAGIVGLALAVQLARLAGLSGAMFVLALGVGLAAGLALPWLVLRHKQSLRSARIESQLASALESLANAMEVGLSLSQALETLARDMPAPLGPEFGQVVRELGMGLPLGEALDGLAQRAPLRDIEIFVAAVHIQYRTGGALGGVLRTLARTVRERVNLRGEVRSMTSQQRLSAYLISALPILIALIMKFVSPAYFDRLLEPGFIRILLVGAVAGVVAGFYFMMRIADIEV
jgi:tight adherence protein B